MQILSSKLDLGVIKKSQCAIYFRTGCFHSHHRNHQLPALSGRMTHGRLMDGWEMVTTAVVQGKTNAVLVRPFVQNWHRDVRVGDACVETCRHGDHCAYVSV